MAYHNPKLLKRLKRNPRSTKKKFYYYPQAIAANPDIPQGEAVHIVGRVDEAGTIEIKYLGKKYLVFLSDLCDVN